MSTKINNFAKCVAAWLFNALRQNEKSNFYFLKIWFNYISHNFFKTIRIRKTFARNYIFILTLKMNIKSCKGLFLDIVDRGGLKVSPRGSQFRNQIQSLHSSRSCSFQSVPREYRESLKTNGLPQGLRRDHGHSLYSLLPGRQPCSLCCTVLIVQAKVFTGLADLLMSKWINLNLSLVTPSCHSNPG